MPRFDFGAFTAEIPPGWEVGADPEDDSLTAVFPPSGDCYVQISSYAGPPDEPTAEELWDFAADTVAPLGITEHEIRRDAHGYALDARDPGEPEGLIAFRLWRERLIFATFYFAPEDALHVSAVEAMFTSLAPVST